MCIVLNCELTVHFVIWSLSVKKQYAFESLFHFTVTIDFFPFWLPVIERNNFDLISFQDEEEQGSITGSDKAAEEEGEDLDEEEYDEEEEEDDDRPRKKPRHGGFILDEAGKNNS